MMLTVGTVAGRAVIGFSWNGDKWVPLDPSRTSGKDVFVFSANNGNDTIHDFRRADEDKIELRKLGATSFKELESGNHLQVDGADTTITFGTNAITVVGVTGLTAGDFQFT